jgi:rod shape-determining protein MreB
MLRRSARRPVVAIDLGTAFIRVGVGDDPVAVERPTAAEPGRPPAMHRGVVYDIDSAAAVLAAAVAEAHIGRLRRAAVLVSVPGTATSVERAGVRWAMHAAGVRTDVELIDEPLAAAVGLGLDIADPRPHLVVDVGHGITEAAVIADGSIRFIAGARLGCAQLLDPSAAPRVLSRICRTATGVIADLSADDVAAIDRLHLVGGGSMMPEVVTHLECATGLPVHLAADRFHAVARGDAACALETFRSARPRPSARSGRPRGQVRRAGSRRSVPSAGRRV